MMEILKQIDQIELVFTAEGKLVLNLTIAIIMFGVALELNIADFKNLLHKPKPILVGVLSQFVLMPFATFVLAILLSSYVTPTIAMGMILVAACPGGNISNFISSLSKGNVALSVSLTAFSSFAGIALTPINFSFWGSLYLKYIDATGNSPLLSSFSLDVMDVVQTVLLILGIPLVAGMLFSNRFPAATKRLIPFIKKGSILAFFTIIMVLFSQNFALFTTYIPYIFFIVLVHNAIALSIGYSAGSAFKLAVPDRMTLAIETGIQNSGLALALLFNPTIFPSNASLGGMVFIAAWWGVWHIISGLTIASFAQKRQLTAGFVSIFKKQ